MCDIDGENNLFSQVRHIRNEILHNSTLELTDQGVARYLHSMIAVLEDKKTLSLDPAAQAAAIKLKEILNEEVTITMSEEDKVIQTALDAIKEARKEAEDSIRKLAEEKQNDIKTSKGNIKGITEESRNALQQQKSESATEMKTVKEQGIANVSSTVSTVFKETYEPEISILKLGHDDHEKRINAVEAEQQNLQTNQLELEKQVAKLTNIEEKHQARIDSLKQRKGLQQYLVDVYQQHYVKTWISPLMTPKNYVNIGDVYVSPKMVVEADKDGNDGNTSEVGKGRGTNHKRIKRYRDLFSTQEKRNRKIFILGDVGTGKSSFCKMMMQNWCSAIRERVLSDESGIIDEEVVKKGEEYNTCDMNQFDFLFYVPLRDMPENIGDTVDMIKAQLEDYKVLIDDIFSNDSERILILADGLDEWTPPKVKATSLHPVTFGIPTSRSARDSTIVTTSRPSSRGILNIKPSQYDLKVTLWGLNESSVRLMIEKYMKLLNKASALSDFKKKLSSLKLKDIQTDPLLLQQIIWLYCNNYDIGQSRSFIYLNIVNIVLGRELKITTANPSLHDFQSKDLEHCPLPEPFDKCQENRKLLLILGKLAYDAYITDSGSSLAFGRNKLKQLHISENEISAILRTGILSECNSADPKYGKSRLSFIHTSYLEFFAALYICSCYLSKIADGHSSGASFTIFEGLIAVTPKTSVAEILRLQNVFVMICGLVPCLTEHVCECIYKITLGKIIDHFQVHRIQKLMLDCSSEHNSVDQETVMRYKLRHFHMYTDVQIARLDMCLTSLDPTGIETCDIRCSTLSHEQCSLLSSCLSQAVSLQALKISDIDCNEYDCEDHIIDLTNQRKLQNIELSQSMISISGINHTCLQSCVITDCRMSHEQCTSLSSCLSQAASLQSLQLFDLECTQTECDSHSVDLTNNNQLKELSISNSHMISITRINPTCPIRRCDISNRNLSHEQCSSLYTFISNAKSLNSLRLHEIKCIGDACEGHDIDLMIHKRLQSLSISKCYTISITGIKHTCPIWACHISNCNLSHEHFTSLCTFISHAESLNRLRLHEIKCIENACAGHDIDITNYKQLESFSISNCNTISLTSINPTCPVSWLAIRNCNLSHEQCTSLCTVLSHAESLDQLRLSEIECIENACAGHDIDLTNHKRLQSLSISNCNTISITGINPTCPITQCDISNCNLSQEQCTSLCTFISHSESLEYLTLIENKCNEDACEGHNVNLTIHKQLKHLSISNFNTISITCINPICSMSCCLINNCNLSHEQCRSLCTLLSHAESLDQLSLRGIKCIEDACEGHGIDLTNHNDLQRLSISNCNTIYITGKNPTCPIFKCDISYCNLSHEQYTSLCTFLSNAMDLVFLDLRAIKCTKDRCEGHYVDFSNHKYLPELSISDCNDIYSTGQ